MRKMRTRKRQRRVHEGDISYIVRHSEGASHGHTVVYKIKTCTMISDVVEVHSCCAIS